MIDSGFDEIDLILKTLDEGKERRADIRRIYKRVTSQQNINLTLLFKMNDFSVIIYHICSMGK